MKKITIILIIGLIMISCNFSQDKESNSNTVNSSKLTGTIENLKDSLTVVLIKMDSRNFYGKNIDSTLSLNGSFELKIENNEPSEYMIMIIDYKNMVAKRNSFWLDKGDISIIGTYDDFENAKINGSKLTELSKRYFAINEKYSNQMKNGEIELKDFHKGINKEQLNFLFKNPNNTVSLSNFLSYTDKLDKDSLQLESRIADIMASDLVLEEKQNLANSFLHKLHLQNPKNREIWTTTTTILPSWHMPFLPFNPRRP